MTPAELIHREKLTPLPSEMLMSYVESFVEQQIILIAFETKTVEAFKQDLKGIKSFIDSCAGVHLRLAVTNLYFDFENKPNELILETCKRIVKDKIGKHEKD